MYKYDYGFFSGLVVMPPQSAGVQSAGVQSAGVQSAGGQSVSQQPRINRQETLISLLVSPSLDLYMSRLPRY
jgi:hypothetical protein